MGFGVFIGVLGLSLGWWLGYLCWGLWILGGKDFSGDILWGF